MSKRITADFKIAHATAVDQANRLMRDKGLTVWDVECIELASETFHKIYFNNEGHQNETG